MFFNDSGERVIYQFDYDLKSGEISNFVTLADLREKELEGSEQGAPECPDGMTIDSEDKLWIALWDGSRVVRYCPETRCVLESVRTGSSQTTSVCGGKLFGKDALFVTSAFKAEDSEKKRSGRSFVILNSTRADFIGVRSHLFRRSLLG